jgi:hypothetical protein
MALATDLGADLDTGFLPVFNTDLACGFTVFFTAALTGFAADFATVFAGLAPGFSEVAIFFTNFLVTLFSVDSPAVLPVSLGLATATGLGAVLPGFLATVLFLTDFVTVAFMYLILNELPNALTSSGAACNFFAVPAFCIAPPRIKTTVVYTKHSSRP